MCYAIPGRIIEISNNIALIDYYGERKEALVDIEGIRTGDYVFAQGGVIVDRLQEEVALSILEGWREAFSRLKEKDKDLAEGEPSPEGLDPEIVRIIRKGEEGIALTRDEMLTLLRCSGRGELNLLYQTANRIRQKVHKNSSCVHGIIEFSNICKNDCAYCGIRKDNHALERYRMEADEIVEVVTSAANQLGFRAFVLQSGEDSYYTTERLTEIIRRIRERCGVLLILSIGERDKECYQELYDAGARGVLIRFETSNPDLYGELHTTLRYEDRIETLKGVREIGYIIATGSLIGLPGQSEEDLLEDILLARSFDTEMYSFGPLIAHPATPLASTPPVDIDTVLKVIALTRLITHDGNALVTSAVETLFGKEGTRQALMAGGNSMMINLTPARYRSLYAIYPREDRTTGFPADRRGLLTPSAGFLDETLLSQEPTKEVENTLPFKGRDKGGDGVFSDEDIQGRISETISLLYSLGRAPTDIGISGTRGSNNKTSS